MYMMLQVWYTVTAAGADASCIYLDSFSFSLLCTIEYTHTVLPNFHIVTPTMLVLYLIHPPTQAVTGVFLVEGPGCKELLSIFEDQFLCSVARCGQAWPYRISINSRATDRPGRSWHHVPDTEEFIPENTAFRYEVGVTSSLVSKYPAAFC